MAELEITLRLNSPGFLGELPRGKKQVGYLVRGRGTDRFEERKDPVDHYPVSPGGLRIPTLRGLLGFWYRALLGGLSSKEVYERQGRLFGSVDHGQGVTLRPAGKARFEARELVYGRRERPYDHVYLGYGPLQILKVPDEGGGSHLRGVDIATSHHRLGCRDAVLVEGGDRPRFSFVARGRPEQLAELRRALTLLHLFGGVGGRSRRGWGSVAVEADGVPGLPGGGDLAAWMAEELKKVLSPEGPADGRPAFSALSRAAEIRVTPLFEGSYDDVLMEFFRRFDETRLWGFRKPSPPRLAKQDHDRELADARAPAHRALTGVPQRLAFGLPYSPRFRGGPTIEYRGRRPGAEPGDPGEVTRRASPLLLKVLHLADGRHAGVALFLDAPFFSDPKMEVGAKGKDLTRPFPGYEAVTDFLAGSRWQDVPLS